MQPPVAVMRSCFGSQHTRSSVHVAALVTAPVTVSVTVAVVVTLFPCLCKPHGCMSFLLVGLGLDCVFPCYVSSKRLLFFLNFVCLPLTILFGLALTLASIENTQSLHPLSSIVRHCSHSCIHSFIHSFTHPVVRSSTTCHTLLSFCMLTAGGILHKALLGLGHGPSVISSCEQGSKTSNHFMLVLISFLFFLFCFLHFMPFSDGQLQQRFIDMSHLSACLHGT